MGPEARVVLSTASTFPEPTASAFELAARLGYDGVEVLVGLDPVSQDAEALRELSAEHGQPVLGVHTPCLLLTQRVWGSEPWTKLERTIDLAHDLHAEVVVVHPAFRWQREYARGFPEKVTRLEAAAGVRVAVENMYPWRTRRRELQAYLPGWDPVEHDYPSVTLDLSHTATAGNDALAMAAMLGDRLAHVHLADGLGSAKDEHLVPGRGNQPCGQLLTRLAAASFSGCVVVEINTRRSGSRELREHDLAEALRFARRHLDAPGAHRYQVVADGVVEAVRRRGTA